MRQLPRLFGPDGLHFAIADATPDGSTLSLTLAADSGKRPVGVGLVVGILDGTRVYWPCELCSIGWPSQALGEDLGAAWGLEPRPLARRIGGTLQPPRYDRDDLRRSTPGDLLAEDAALVISIAEADQPDRSNIAVAVPMRIHAADRELVLSPSDVERLHFYELLTGQRPPWHS